MQEYHLRHRTLPDCSVRELLQSSPETEFAADWFEEFEKYLQPIGPLHRGEHLYRASEPAEDIFLVYSGCYKLYAYDPAGREYIHGFRLRGSLLGLHSVGRRVHQFNAVVLTESVVYKMNIRGIAEIGRDIPAFCDLFLKLVTQELVSNVFLSGNFTAEERVACFLISFSKKLRLSFDDPEPRLPMSRGDIATYLRLTLPTVSRILSKFKQNGIISSDYHHIQIMDHDRMMEFCKNVPLVEA